MAIPRSDPLKEKEVQVEQYGARSIRVVKSVEGAAVETHDLSEHTGSAASIGAAGAVHSHVPVPDILVSDTQIANADVLTLRATQVELIAAPGAGLALIVHRVYIVVDDTAGAYTETTDDLAVEYADGVNITNTIDATPLVGGGVQRTTIPALATQVVPDVNAAVQMDQTGGGEWGGGNAANTMSVRVWYSVVPAAAFS